MCGPQSGTCAVLCLILSKRGMILGEKDFCCANARRNGSPLNAYRDRMAHSPSSTARNTTLEAVKRAKYLPFRSGSSRAICR